MTEVRAPAELRHITRLIGDDAAFALIEARGGTRVFLGAVARKRGTSRLLTELIGAELADRLVEGHGAPVLEVPVARAWRAQVYQARGLSHAAIARKLQMSENGVRRMLGRQRAKADSGQLSLAV